MNDLWVNFLLPTLKISGIITLYLIIKNLLPSYFSEKGKNLATKDDIAKITSLVESVKHTFTTETEKLKANLQLLTNIQVGVESEERNAIVDLNEKYFKWLNFISEPTLNNVDLNDNNEIIEILKKQNELYNDFLFSIFKIGLFIKDQDLVIFTRQLQIETLNHIWNVSSKCALKIAHLNDEYDPIIENLSGSDKLLKQQELLDKKGMIKDQLRDGIINGFEVITPMSINFQKLCREHIYKTLHKQS